MLTPELCPHYSLCGFCTKFDKPCEEVCNEKVIIRLKNR